MSISEQEIRDLREKNSELAVEVQSLKILNAQKDKEKLELTKEVNELRLKLSRLRSGSTGLAKKFDADLQASSEEALSHIVQASGAIARSVELCKQYVQERQELELASPRWSHISGNTSAKRVNEVPPLLLGGQSIQPVVALSRTMLQNRSINRTPNQNSGVTHRALPLNLLQDAYIPLTRIDVSYLQSNNLSGDENADLNNSAEDLGLEDSTDQINEVDDSHIDEPEESQMLTVVEEESLELEDEVQTSPRAQSEQNVQNPLEGPSWLLDVADEREQSLRATKTIRPNLEPDSTTPCETPLPHQNESILPHKNESTLPHQNESIVDIPTDEDDPEKEEAALSRTLSFTPTVRRRKRTATSTSTPPSPHTAHTAHTALQPALAPRRHSRRKVVVDKMRVSDEDPGAAGDSSPPKRAARAPPAPAPAPAPAPQEAPPTLDAPSPNGATDKVTVGETHSQRRNARRLSRSSRRDSVKSHGSSRCPSRGESECPSRGESPNSTDFRLEYSDSESEMPARRSRKKVSYKEKPLNRKLRR